FDLIDKGTQDNGDGILEVHELEEATKNPNIKEITNKYVVKHSSEWDKTQNMVDVLQNIVDNIDNSEFENKDKYIEMLKKEKKRIENLSFFSECKSISDFPQSDMVYVINPIGLVNEFNNLNCGITEDDLVQIFPNSSENRRKEVVFALNKYCHEFEINTLDRMAHFLGQIGTETGELEKLHENYKYNAERIYEIFLKKAQINHPIKSNKKTYKYHALIEGYDVDLSSCPYTNGDYGHKRVENPIEIDPNWSYANFVSAGYSIKNEYVRSTKLFDYVYGCRMGNGAKLTEDGSDYFGVGFIHLTGKEQYTKIHEKWNQLYPNEPKDFLGEDIQLLKTNVDIAMKSAMIFWTFIKKINDIVKSENDINLVTYTVNGGYNGLDDRVKYTKKAYEVLKNKQELNK
ncbi:MAG: hypothetical protein PHG81_11300, partial [Aliarcobacter sp.]|nr:hypothetical protein [Aliarcobacter sp.]